MNENWREVLGSPESALFTLGVVAELLGVDAQAVRRYDHEVVHPARSVGHQRRYSTNDIVRLARALVLADEGIPLVGIRRIMDLEDELASSSAVAPS